MDNQAKIQPAAAEHSEVWLEGVLAKVEEQLFVGNLAAQNAIRYIVSLITAATDIAGASIAIIRDGVLVCKGSAGVAPQADSVLDSSFGVYTDCISSGRVVASADAVVAFEAGKPVFRPVTVLPLWSGGRIQGVLAAFSSTTRNLGHGYVAALGSAALMAGLVIEQLDRATTNSTVDAPAEPALQAAELDPSGTQAIKQQALLAELLNRQAAPAKSPTWNRKVLLISGLGFFLACGTLFGAVQRFRKPVRNQDKSISASAQQLCTVILDVGSPVPSDRAELTNRGTPTITGGQLRKRVDPVYPDLALRNALEGEVNGVIVVDQKGAVNEMRISSGNPILATALASALEHWRYSPFYLSTHPAAVIIPVRAIFRLKEPLMEKTRGAHSEVRAD